VGLTPVHPAPSVVAAVLVLGIAGTGAAYVVNYQLIADEGATAASVVTYLIPVVAVVLGAAFLAEPVTATLALGAITILAGVALSEGHALDHWRKMLAWRTISSRRPAVKV
jgi:drug/metabolite transporter (DMT)-like permease